MNRANHKKKNMGLTSWEGSPEIKIHKYDVSVAKNYLNEDELGQLSRIASSYLDYAGAMAKRHIPMTMADWEERLNKFLELWNHDILKDSGRITHEIAKAFAETEFEQYRIIQDKTYKSDFDKLLEESAKLEEL